MLICLILTFVNYNEKPLSELLNLKLKDVLTETSFCMFPYFVEANNREVIAVTNANVLANDIMRYLDLYVLPFLSIICTNLGLNIYNTKPKNTKEDINVSIEMIVGSFGILIDIYYREYYKYFKMV